MKIEEAQRRLLGGSAHSVAVSLDTSIFIRNRLKLEAGLLSRLEQFRDAQSKLVISDVVQHEVLKHLEDEAKSAEAEFRKALKSIGEHWLSTEDARMTALSTLLENKDAIEVARTRLQTFIKRCNATLVLTNELIGVGDLMTRYFSNQQPFEVSGNKKCEFPDAAALMSLEEWSKRNHMVIVLVSGDRGWHAFAEQSSRLCCVESLKEALAIFQQPTDVRVAVDHVADLLERQKSYVLQRVADRLSSVSWEGEVSSYFEGEADIQLTEATVQFASGPIQQALKPVDFRDNKLTVVAQFTGEIDIDADVGFSTGGTSLGGCSVSQKHTIPFEALLTFVNPAESVLQLVSVELLENYFVIDLGELEPDYSDEDPSHERY